MLPQINFQTCMLARKYKTQYCCRTNLVVGKLTLIIIDFLISHLLGVGISIGHPGPGIALRHPSTISAPVPVTIWTVPLQVELLRHRVHLLEGLSLLLLRELLNGKKAILSKLYPLGGVAHAGIFYQCTKDHKKADPKVNVYRLHVGNFRQRSVHAGHEGCHCEHRGHPQPHLRQSRFKNHMFSSCRQCICHI